MDGLHEALGAWENEGVVSFEQVRQIESRQGATAAPSRIVELAAYLGSGLLLFGALFIGFDLFLADFLDPNEWGAFLVVAAASIITYAAGILLLRSTDSATGRGAGWVLGLAVFSGGAALAILFGAIAETGDDTVLLVGLGTSVYALVAWRYKPSVPTQLMLFIGIVLTLIGLLVVTVLDAIDSILGSGFGSFSTWTGVVLALFGATWIVLGRLGTMTPANTAYALGSTTLIIAVESLYATDTPWLIAVFIVAVWLAWLGSTMQRSVLVAFGGVAAFAGLGSLLGEIFDSPGAGFGWTAAILGMLVLAYAVYQAQEEPAGALPPESTPLDP